MRWLLQEAIMQIFVVILFVAAGSAAWAADAGSCYSIPDHDARMLCLARAHGDPGRCYAISDSGLRSACLAALRRCSSAASGSCLSSFLFCELQGALLLTTMGRA